MKLNKIFQIFVPTEQKFFPLFNQNAEYIVKAAVLLNQMLMTNDPTRVEGFHKNIKEYEHLADNVTHQIFEELNTTFITPFDRDDIQKLASTMDDVIDYINGAAQKIKLYKPKRFPKQFVDLSDLIVQATREIQVAINELKNLKDPQKIKKSCIRINEIENLADDVFHFGITDFFENQLDAIELIKEKDILSTLEKATDRAEDVSDVIKTIIVKLA
ncbi:MAG: hypothetical protein A2X12_01305 [Bacteroidetes bacterium GWE2_29_8]|nr:MAG: hypothetical protein A2X12_01305 [Bacteroidetes bacterium GWE2_29_8]OFY21750.1 MAG: hypothetical protein A2X02_00280 [Bacteroidetes bacterium GWF2_29_10]